MRLDCWRECRDCYNKQGLLSPTYGLAHISPALAILPRHVLLAAVPGSAPSHLVYLLELATGIAVETRDSWGPHHGATWNHYTRAYGLECGFSARCDRVHRSRPGDIVITETAFPFSLHGDSDINVADKLARYDSFNDVDLVILLVRNPFDAMVLHDIGPELAEAFMHAWAHHADYWILRSSPEPVLIVRAEDLLKYPEHVLGRILIESGIRDRFFTPALASDIADVVKEWRKPCPKFFLFCTRKKSNISTNWDD